MCQARRQGFWRKTRPDGRHLGKRESVDGVGRLVLSFRGLPFDTEDRVLELQRPLKLDQGLGLSDRIGKRVRSVFVLRQALRGDGIDEAAQMRRVVRGFDDSVDEQRIVIRRHRTVGLVRSQSSRIVVHDDSGCFQRPDSESKAADDSCRDSRRSP